MKQDTWKTRLVPDHEPGHGRRRTPIPGIIENLSFQCPFNHPISETFKKDPAFHLQICKCHCQWCIQQFGDISEQNWGNAVRFR